MLAIKSLFIFVLLCITHLASSQIYLQLEIFNQAKTIKYSKGEIIHFQKKATADEWYSMQIQDILVDDGIILFDNDFVRVEDISKVRRSNVAAKYVGKSLMTFALAYALYGVIIEVFTDNDSINTTNMGIAAGAFASGYTLNKLFGTKIYWIGKTSRMRIIDLRFYVPE